MKNRGKSFPFLLTVSLLLFTHCKSAPPSAPLFEFSETDWYERTQTPDRSTLYAPHVDSGGLFFNPWLERERIEGSRSWLSRKKEEFEKFPETQYGNVPNDFSYLSDNSFNSITFAGHASFIIKMDNQTIFTDPFFSKSALIVRKKVKIKFDFSKVPQRPLVLISHNHYDHLDKYSVKRLARKDAIFIVPLGLKK